MLHQAEYKLGCQQNQGKQAAHAFQDLHTQVFDIQALFLIKVVTTFDTSSQAPIRIDLFRRGFVLHRHIGQQDQCQVIFCHQHPQFLLRFRQAQAKPAHFDLGDAAAPGMLEKCLECDFPGHISDQVLQLFCLPAVQLGFVDFHQTLQVRGGDHKFGLGLLDPGKHLLIIAAATYQESQALIGKDLAGGADRALDLPVLTQEVGRLIGKIVGIPDRRYQGVDHCNLHRQVTPGQVSLAFQVGRRLLIHIADPFQIFGVGLLEVDRSQGDQEVKEKQPASPSVAPPDTNL